MINDRQVTAMKNETILDVARREGIYIPTMCYLPKVSPIASCRLCIVDVENTDGFVLSCQTPPTEGIHVKTQSQALDKERRRIMELYNVNHPLECGVCDKSGECDLQNKTLEMGIVNQSFSAKETHKTLKEWGLINYEPSLCIMCEKCVSTCNEVIGDDAIEIQFGGYNSTIIPKNSETLECTSCGECIAVCPVGAMTSSDFRYDANAWELRKVPSSCVHCSSGCHLWYEVKHTSNSDTKPSIYRVKNDFEFTTLCGASRFGYDFENNAVKDSLMFEKTLNAFKKADTIRFTSLITNEEALILQRLKEQCGYKLVNEDAYAFQSFLNAFQTTSNQSLYSANSSMIEDAKGIIVFGTQIRHDAPSIRYALTQASKKHRSKIAFMHPIEDQELSNVVTQFIKYEAGSEEGVVAMLLSMLTQNKALESSLETFIKEFDIGYLSAETNIGEEELEAMMTMFKRVEKPLLIAGSDLYLHPESQNIARILGLLQSLDVADILLLPSQTNTLGVSLICDLDTSSDGYSIGYNTNGDFILSALELDGSSSYLDMPALTQQEGTLTTLDKRVVSINAALPYEGYSLGDIANQLGLNIPYTVSLTSQLPLDKGYQSIGFDQLGNSFSRLGEDLRGYFLVERALDYCNEIPKDVEEIDTFNGTVIYRCLDVLQFNEFTSVAHQLEYHISLMGSEQFARIAKVSDGQNVTVKMDDIEVRATFILDSKMKGTIAMLNTFQSGLKAQFKPDGYRFVKAQINATGSVNE